MKKEVYWLVPILVAMFISWQLMTIFTFLGFFILAISFYKIIKEETIKKSVYYLILDSLLFTISLFIAFFIKISPLKQMAAFGLILITLVYFSHVIALNSLILLTKKSTKKADRRGKLVTFVVVIVVLVFILDLFVNFSLWKKNMHPLYLLATIILLMIFVWFVRKRNSGK